MTVYARNDIAAVAISASAGGCGDVHNRPTPNGAPVKLWALVCPSCETVLTHDSNWGGQPHQVPETPDETAIREDIEQRGQVEQAASVAQALKDLAKLGDLPAALAAAMSQFMSGNQQQAPALPAAPAVEPTAPELPVEDAIPNENDIAHMSMAQLKNLAVKMGVSTVRSRIEQQKLIYEALETVNN
jgi:hypothetical protein